VSEKPDKAEGPKIGDSWSAPEEGPPPKYPLRYRAPPEVRQQLRLSVSLQGILSATDGPDDPPLTLGLIIEKTQERAFGVLMAFLCLPFVQPIPLPGLSIVFGIALALLGAQIAIRRNRPWLPHRMLAIKLPQKLGAKVIAIVAKIFRPLEKIVRPRMLFMQNTWSLTVVGVALVIDGIFLVVLPPFPGSNIIPGWMALIKILGITEEDGICLLVGTVISLAAVVAIAFGGEALYEWAIRLT
jgi:hypothetical protein